MAHEITSKILLWILLQIVDEFKMDFTEYWLVHSLMLFIR